MKILQSSLIICLALLAAGCQSYDYTLLEERDPRSILIIPPANSTVEVDAPYVFLSTITRPLAERGYYVYPVAVIDTLFKENGLPTTAEMNNVPLDKIREIIDADAILYIHITDWGQKYYIIQSSTVVEATWRLVDGRTGELLWDTEVDVSDSSGFNLIEAAVDQIIGELFDRAESLSRQANNKYIYNDRIGLLPGPYRREYEDQ